MSCTTTGSVYNRMSLLLLLLLQVRDCIQCVHQLVHFLIHPGQLLFDAIQPGAHSHRLEVAYAIHSGKIAARFAECLIQSSLQLLDAHHHVQMALRILFYHVPYIIGLPCLLKLPAGHKVLDFPYRSDCIAMGIG